MIHPLHAPQEAPKGTVTIHIGFRFPLNYVFVSENITAISQICAVLPEALAQSAGLPLKDVKIARLVPLDHRAIWGYVTTIAEVYYPTSGCAQDDVAVCSFL